MGFYAPKHDAEDDVADSEVSCGGMQCMQLLGPLAASLSVGGLHGMSGG